MNIQEILSLFHKGKTTAKSHMKNLIEMAAADGNFDQIEYDLLKQIAKKNNISESQLKDIRANSSGIKFELPTDKIERFHQFYDLVHMMSVDESIHPEEMKLCSLYALKFGYPRQRSTELIDTIQSNIKYGQSPDETYKRVELLLS
ncbi:MAG: hypothetical protein JSS79_12810 [Bacteroidetes bacterium]|nr:hypothetical protein [Bacteroidota bacterium]